ncbi:Ascorbate peroxidase [Thalictrum thalictroides]|uniref:Ascorbate peroxidase n=1 Tax=Thalictrum thalictroides TaxID=46969 RepID=A0A7J6WL65_THATH|nr:Ascorbate peroxidase [Thalictrum thalictroides]
MLSSCFLFKLIQFDGGQSNFWFLELFYQGLSIDDGSANGVPEKFVAAKYSSGKRELSAEMKRKIRAEYEGFGGSPDKPLQSNYFLNIIVVIGVLAILTYLFGN